MRRDNGCGSQTRQTSVRVCVQYAIAILAYQCTYWPTRVKYLKKSTGIVAKNSVGTNVFDYNMFTKLFSKRCERYSKTIPNILRTRLFSFELGQYSKRSL